jgi:hypothetical protein
MFKTVETRWFGLGRMPAEVLAWFNTFEGAAEPEPRRLDHYLHLGSNDELGVKIREGALDVKKRQHSYGLVHLHRNIMGLVEVWSKWRFTLQDPESAIVNGRVGPNGWLAVEKERQLRRYQIDSDLAVQIATPQVPSDSSCTLELASVKAGGTAWWTIAFEVSGNSHGLYERLLAVTDHLFALKAPPPLAATDSYGYPYWLATFVSDH